MTFFEKELEDFLYILLTQDIESLGKRGFDIELDEEMKYYRQLDLGSYGVADIVGFKHLSFTDDSNYIEIHVIELKKDQVGYKAIGQACRYAVGILQALNKAREKGCLLDLNIDIRITTVGTSVFNDDSVFIPTLCHFSKTVKIDCYTASFDPLDGILFNKSVNWIKGNDDSAPMSILLLDAFKNLEDYA